MDMHVDLSEEVSNQKLVQMVGLRPPTAQFHG